MEKHEKWKKHQTWKNTKNGKKTPKMEKWKNMKNGKMEIRSIRAILDGTRNGMARMERISIIWNFRSTGIYIKLRGRPPIWRGGVRILLEHQAPGEEGLQSYGPKAVLAIGLVFGRSYAAASTTLSGEKTFGKTHANQKENITKYKAELRAPPCGPVSQKSITASPKTVQASQRQPKGRHENAQETPEEPKGCQKTAGGIPKCPKK